MHIEFYEAANVRSYIASCIETRMQTINFVYMLHDNCFHGICVSIPCTYLATYSYIAMHV